MMDNKKIMFITPPYHCGVVEVAGRWIPLTFVYLAASARDVGFEPIIYDAMTLRHTHEDIRKKIEDTKPAIVATTAITSTFPDAIEILKNAKEIDPSIKTIIGGVHPTFMYREVLESEYVDFVVRGEGEITLRELLITLKNGGNLRNVKGIAFREADSLVVTPPREFINDLDSLGGAWDLLEWKHYRYFVIPHSRLGAISTSRGCNHDCTFCSQQKFWHQKWRARDPLKVVQEIEYLYKTYGVNVFLITDEYPTQDRVRWERFLDLLIERDLGVYLLMETRAEDILRDEDILYKYRKAGIVHVYIGVESTDQETLDLIKKDIKVETGVKALRLIHEHDMISETSFILGFPEETKESIKRTLELSKYYNPDFAHYLAITPWPYADMFEQMKPYIKVFDYRKYNLIDPIIEPKRMSLQDIDKAIIDCYQSFYMGKLKDLLTLKNDFKRRYILHSMKLIMNSSFIVDKLGSLGKIPPQVEALMKKLQRSSDVRLEPVAQEEDVVSLARESIYIDLPVDQVYEIVSNPTNWPSFVKGLEEISLLDSASLSANTEFRWVYRIKGIKVSGKGKAVRIRRNRSIILQLESIMPIREIIDFKPEGNGTLLTVEVGYKNPGRVLSFIFSAAKKMLNIKETITVLNRIKTFCEKGKYKKEATSI